MHWLPRVCIFQTQTHSIIHLLEKSCVHMRKAEKASNVVIVPKFSEHLKSTLGLWVSLGHWQESLQPVLVHFVSLRFKIQPRNLKAFALFSTSIVESQILFLPTRKKGSFTVRTVIYCLPGWVIWIWLWHRSWSSEVIRSMQWPGPQQRCWPYLMSMLQSWSYSDNRGKTQSLQFPCLASPCLSAAGYSQAITKWSKKELSDLEWRLSFRVIFFPLKQWISF